MAGSISTPQPSSGEPTSRTRGAFGVLTLLFFMWGFITCLNDILIPYLKEVFELNYFEAMFIQFAFFGAYFLGSLVYFLISMKYGDPITRMGYKNGIIMRLCNIINPFQDLSVGSMTNVMTILNQCCTLMSLLIVHNL